jgi:hypothetical protein
MLNNMATSLFSPSHKRISLGAVLVLALMFSPYSRGATLINDGTTTDGLARMANATNLLEEFFGPADSTLAPDSGALLAAQFGLALPPLRTMWFSAESAPTNGEYRVAADFLPAEVRSECRGGVMGWLNTGRSNGIVLQVVPYGQDASFRVATVDFLAEDANANESATNLYHLDGTPATAEIGSSWSELGANYVATSNATFELTFTAPTAADTNVLSNVTARVTAKVFQVDASGVTNQVSTMIEMLTDLPLPESGAHALGYFAVWASESDYGVIGYLDNLVADNVGTRPNTPPSIQITNPAPGTVFAELATITLEADAQDSDGSVRTVEFFAGATSLGTLTNAPFSLAWANVPAGNYSLTARATDNRGGTSTSAVVAITVNALPSVRITSPAPNASFLEPATITFEVDAQDTDGSISSVAYFDGATPLGTVTNAPFTFTWSNVLAGQYSLTAQATDDRGMMATSAPVNTTVSQSSGTAPTMTVTYTSNGMVLAWGAAGYQLQIKTDLGSGVWTDWPEPTLGFSQVTVPYSSGVQFFRLVGAGAPTGPALTVHLANGQITVSWPAGVTGYRLQTKAGLNAGAWTDLTTSGNTYSESAASGNRFFRLVNP